jgi:5-(carboxyamino)imidazole ribonucleotide mutase
MPSGVPVASVAIDNGKNAALLAIEILALKEPNLLQNLHNYRKKIS